MALYSIFFFRITGLDPARALFEGTFGFFKQLDRTCALFVDIIHTDAGNYGTSKSTGTVDIWPNYYGPKSQQPGCPRKPQETFSRAGITIIITKMIFFL